MSEEGGLMKLVIIGACGHGKVIADIAEKCGYQVAGFLDDDKEKKSCLEYSVLGSIEDASKYSDCEFIVAIGDARIREKVQLQLKMMGLHIGTLIHPDAVIARDVTIGEGTVIMAGAILNPSCVIGEGCIINTGASLDHDGCLGEYVHVSVGSHLAGKVSVGKYTWIGAGAIVINNIEICDSCMVGAGAVVVKDIKEMGTYIGVPARKMEVRADMAHSEINHTLTCVGETVLKLR